MFDNWVTKYAMSYSLNGKHWLMVGDKRKNDGSPRVTTNMKLTINFPKKLTSSAWP